MRATVLRREGKAREVEGVGNDVVVVPVGGNPVQRRLYLGWTVVRS